MSSNKINYSQIEAAASLDAVDINSSEIHGTIVGALANHFKSGQKPDLSVLLFSGQKKAEQQKAGGQENGQAFNDLLHELYREIADGLLEGGEGFELILANEDEALDYRTESLALWCRGYMLGLLYNESFNIDQLTENGAEIVRDIMAISEAESGMADDTEEDWALAELEEYVKVGVQLIFEGIYSERAAEAPALSQ